MALYHFSVYPEGGAATSWAHEAADTRLVGEERSSEEALVSVSTDEEIR